MHRHGGGRQHGASLVEFALLAPVLFLILLGTITGGLSLSRQNSVKNAVREATRFGAVLPNFDDTTANLNALYAQVVSAATGDLDVGVDDREICVALIDDDNSWEYQLYGATATPASPSASALATCQEGFDASVGSNTQRIWVRAHRTSEVQAILYADDWDLDARSLARYER